MKIRVYQINRNRDAHHVAYMPYDLLETMQGNKRINSKIYDMVYDNNVDCSNLENVYIMLNINHPSDYHGRSLSVSDIVEVYESDAVPCGFYFCDDIGFKRVEFNYR